MLFKNKKIFVSLIIILDVMMIITAQENVSVPNGTTLAVNTSSTTTTTTASSTTTSPTTKITLATSPTRTTSSTTRRPRPRPSGFVRMIWEFIQRIFYIFNRL